MAKKPMIRYTNRDFNSIRNDLVEHVKRYYPDTYKDFNVSSFGSLMLDTVAYVGDVLSFYMDYNANEQFLSTAVEYKNVIKLAQQHGYRHAKVPTSTGFCTFYTLMPPLSTGTPDEKYAPILKRGTEVAADTGAVFMLAEDINFADPSLETVVATVNQLTGQPIFYARKAHGRVVSGVPKIKTVVVGSFRRFRRINLSDSNVAEIIEVVDTEGHQYHEVEYLTQNVVYKAVTNNNSATFKTAPFVLKAFPAPRRFVVEVEEDTTYLRFGFGTEADLGSDNIVDPTNLVLDLYGKDYSTDEAFDPYKLLNNDKLGVSPANTTVVIRYRHNNVDLINASSRTVNTIMKRIVDFASGEALVFSTKTQVINSIEVENDEPIVGSVSLPDAEEIRIRALGSFASQNRAVTGGDYKALIYAMDKRFGAIKRCNIVKDEDSFKNNLNIYVVSEDEDEFFVETNSTIKMNLKTWLSRYKMINDSIDILDAIIVNFGVEFEIICSLNYNKYDVLERCLSRLEDFFNKTRYHVGEAIKITEMYKTISGVTGVVDVANLSVIPKIGSGYAGTGFSFDIHRSPDGRYVLAPENVIFELRYPTMDVRGGVK